MTRRSVQEYLAAQRERIRAGPACGPQPVAGRDGRRHGLSPEGHHSSSCARLPLARDVAAASAGPGSTTARWRARHRSSGRPRSPIGAKRRQPFVPELLERLTACGPLRVAPETARLLRQISISTLERLLAPARRTGSRRALRASRSHLQGPLVGMGVARVADWPARSKWIGRTAVAVVIALSILKAAGTDASLLFDARYEAKSYLRRNVPKDAIVEAYSTPTYLPRLREIGFPVRLIAEQSSGDDALSGPALVARAPDVIVLSSKHLEGTAPEYAEYFNDLRAGNFGHPVTVFRGNRPWLKIGAGDNQGYASRVSPTIWILERRRAAGVAAPRETLASDPGPASWGDSLTEGARASWGSRSVAWVDPSGRRERARA